MNRRQLKILAVCCMVFDHAARIFPLYRMLAPLADALWAMGYEPLSNWVLDDLTLYLLYIGRLAAPIFVYGITQGFVHTADVRHYLGRLLLTACAAQIPYTAFDLAESRLYGMEGDWREVSLNILFTLAVCLAVLAAHEELRRRRLVFLSPLAAVLAAGFAAALNMEGGKGYIFLAYVFYLTRNRPRWQRALLYIPAVMLSRWGLVMWTVESLGTPELFLVLRNCLLNVLGNYLGMLITLLDNGEKGRTGKAFQRFMYAFYPAHFALLAAIGFLRPPLV